MPLSYIFNALSPKFISSRFPHLISPISAGVQRDWQIIKFSVPTIKNAQNDEQNYFKSESENFIEI